MPPPLAAAAAYDVAYRPISDGDLPFLCALYASTRAEEVAQTGWPLEAQHQFLTSQFEAQHSHYQAHYPAAEWLVIEVAGAEAGRLYIEEWERELRVIDIALLPAFRGKGIGKAILEDVIALARSKDKAVSIHVEMFNTAMHLYDRLGFEKIDEHGVYYLMEWRPEPS